MRKLLVALIIVLSLLTSPQSNAGPLDWIKHHKRFLLMEGAAITGAAIHYKGLNHCRKNNSQEYCDERYGNAYGFFWFLTGVDVIAMPAIAESCWKGGGGKFCYALAYTGPAYQTGHGIFEWRVDEYEIEPHAPTPDLLKLRR